MTAPYRLPTTFQTSRYHLRQATPDDAQAIFDAYGTDRNVTRYLAWRPHESVSDTAAFLQIAADQWDRGTGFAVVARPLAQPDQIIGMFHPQLFGHRLSYGYVLRASAWGQGCASEVMRWLVDHALSHPAIHRAEAFCDVDNPASARVMEKAGMQREGLLRRYFVHPNISDAPRDCLIYAKVR